jgi:hypothetical protein
MRNLFGAAFALVLAALSVIALNVRARQITSNDPSAQSHAIILATGTPTLGACGASASLDSNAHDGWGQINVGTGVVLSCTLNFSKTFDHAPACLVGTSATTVVPSIATTTTGLTVGLSVSLSGGKLFYLCLV